MTAPERDPPSVVALVGLRCSGKSSIGRALAQELGRPFVDLDDEIVAEAFATGAVAKPDLAVGDVLTALGEPAFRDLETRALDRVLATTATCVIATGGGAVEAAANRDRLARDTAVVWLRAKLETLAARLRADATSRPSLTGADPADELGVLARRRDPLYRDLATVTVDVDAASVPALATRVRGLLAAAGGS